MMPWVWSRFRSLVIAPVFICGNVFAQRLVLKSVDVELATGQNFKEFEIIVAEKD